MITDFYLATIGDAAAIVSGSTSYRPVWNTENADNAVLADLWAAMEPTADVDSLRGIDCIVASDPGGSVVLEMPARFIEQLVGLTEADIELVAEGWAIGDEMVHMGVTGPDLLQPLNEIRAIALQSHEAGVAVLLLLIP